MRELVLRMGRRLRRHLTLSIADAPDRLEAERRGIRAFLEFVRANPNLYRVVAEAQFVDPDVYRRYYEDFAKSYGSALRLAGRRGEISKGDAEVRAWALMGISDMVGMRYALWDGKTKARPGIRGRVRTHRQGPGTAPPRVKRTSRGDISAETFMRTIPDFARQRALLTPDAIAFRDVASGRAWTLRGCRRSSRTSRRECSKRVASPTAIALPSSATIRRSSSRCCLRARRPASFSFR